MDKVQKEVGRAIFKQSSSLQLFWEAQNHKQVFVDEI